MILINIFQTDYKHALMSKIKCSFLHITLNTSNKQLKQ